MADPVTLHSLPLFMRLAGRPVILLGEGEAADAKRRLLGRAGAVIVNEDADAALAIVAIEEEELALGAITRLKGRGILVNAVDRPAHCDFTLPAIVDRAPVLVAIGTGGASAGLAAALRQRLEALLPADLGARADALFSARTRLRAAFPDGTARRRALADAMAPGAQLDPFRAGTSVEAVFSGGSAPAETQQIRLRSADPDDLTLREARWLASADRVFHADTVAAVILDRARADAIRINGPMPAEPGPGLSVGLT